MENDGKLSTAWITYHLERKAEIDDICIKLTGWRKRSYPWRFLQMINLFGVEIRKRVWGIFIYLSSLYERIK